jgi:hypothetical protein
MLSQIGALLHEWQKPANLAQDREEANKDAFTSPDFAHNIGAAHVT